MVEETKQLGTINIVTPNDIKEVEINPVDKKAPSYPISKEPERKREKRKWIIY